MSLSRRSPVLALVGASIFIILLGSQGIILLPTQAQKPKVSLNPSGLINKTFDDCERILGKPAYVEGFGTENAAKGADPNQQTRYYTAPGVTRVLLWSGVDDTSGKLYPRPGNVEYQFTPTLAKTWQQAFRRISLSIAGVKARKRDGSQDCDLKNIPGGYEASWLIHSGPAHENCLIVGHVHSDAQSKSASAKSSTITDTAQISDTGQISILFDLHTALGKGFTAFETTLGPPVTRQFFKASPTIYAGETRDYRSASLEAKGVSRVALDAFIVPDTPHAVTEINVVFQKGTTLTWQEVLALVGVSPENVTASEGTATMPGKKCKFVKLSQISITGVPMEKEKPTADRTSVDMISGYAVYWYEQGSLFINAPTLHISYENH